jgi:uncharacterized protein (DUF302 family)
MRIVKSSFAHRDTLTRLLDAIARRGLTVFAQFDHAGAAREVGMEMPNEVVVAFGNPRAGTPLMQEDPRIGIELPLRILVWDDGDVTNVGFNDPRGLSDLYDVAAHAAALEAMSSLLDQLAHEAAADQDRSSE